MPILDSRYLGFILWLLPAYLVALILHELAHLVAGRLGGLRVVSCGIGSSKPWMSVRIAGTVFYFGLPLTRGLTTFTWDGARVPSRAMAIAMIAGPLGSFLISGLVLIALSMGCHADALLALFCLSCSMGLVTAWPWTPGTAGLWIPSDGRQFWNHVSNQRPAVDPGASLDHSLQMLELQRAIDCIPGQVSYLLSAVKQRIDLCDFAGARAMLGDGALTDPKRDGRCRVTEVLVRAALSAAEDPVNLAASLDEARKAVGDDRAAHLVLEIIELRTSVADTSRSAEWVARAMDLERRAHDLQMPYEAIEARALQFIADPAKDVLVTAESLLAGDLHGPIPPLIALKVRVETLRELVRQELWEEIRGLMPLATSWIEVLAERIPRDVPKTNFISRFEVPLRGVIAAVPPGEPVLIPEHLAEARHG